MALPLVPAAPAKNSGPFDLLVPGLYAWGVTVAWPASQRLAPLEAKLFALAALVALVVGAGLAFAWPPLGRALGIWMFLLACVASWAKVTPALFLARLDPLQGTLGAFGWGLFAWSWARQHRAPAPSAVEAGPPSTPRQKLPAHLPIVFGLLAAAAAVPMILAWWVRGLERALLAHVVALAAAIALVSAAAELVNASVRGRRGGERPGSGLRLAGALPALIALIVVAVAGAAWGLLR